MYFIWGEDQYIIEANKKKIINQSNVIPIIFDLNTAINDIINEIDTVSLFNDSKIIIVDNINAFNMKNFIEADEFLKCLEHISDNIILIFILRSKKLLYSNPLVDYLLKNAILIESHKPKQKDLISIIKNIIKNRESKISNKAILCIILNLPNDLFIINNEIEKLLLITNNIKEEHINLSIEKYNKTHFFALSNAIILGNSKEIIEAYYAQINNNIDPLAILSQLSNNYQLAYLIELYKKRNYLNEDISRVTEINIYRINKLEQLLNNQIRYSLKNIINKITILDEKIKNGIIEKKMGLDQFILDVITDDSNNMALKHN